MAICIVALWSEVGNIVVLSIIKGAHPCKTICSVAPRTQAGLTGDDAGFDAGDLDRGDVLDLRWLVALLQQVPHLNVAILLSDEEHSGSRLGPVTHRAHLLGARRLHDRAVLGQERLYNVKTTQA